MVKLGKNPFTDYCPYADCPRKKEKVFVCLRRYFKAIERYCPLFGYTEEERQEFFREMERKGTKYIGW